MKNYSEFWNWFQSNEQTFFDVVRNQKDIENCFFSKLAQKFSELKDGYFYLAGMYDENTVELILTADGIVKNIVFVEELVERAPEIKGWKFTALKPAVSGFGQMRMNGYEFNSENLFFYSNDIAGYPDAIDISVIHNDLTDENREQIVHGVYIFLDNFLGELDFANNIDNLKILGRHEAERELIPITKLTSFITWRQKEFVERYDTVRYNTDDDQYSMCEAVFDDGCKLIAIINTQLLDWDHKVSHPWIGIITIKYDGNNNYGMPNNNDYESLSEIEDGILQQLSDKDGYLYIGRQTAQNERDIYFACKDFRKPAKVFFNTQQKYEDEFEIEYDIYKDKYWQSFERFRAN